MVYLRLNTLRRQKVEYDGMTKNQRAITEGDTNEAIRPVYTLPENTTLVGSQAMTALLGRVPVNDKVTDPYPFKVLIGKDNLTANGIELPDVEGAIISGTAAGDVLSQSQLTTQTNGYGGATSSLTGDAGKAVLGQAAAGGFKAVSEWVKARYGQTFDAVYVPPGASVAVHITQQIPIDYDTQGRKVKYPFSLEQENSDGLD